MAKEKFVRDKPHVNMDAAVASETETTEQSAGEHDHGKAMGCGCKMDEMKAEGGACKMQEMKAEGGGCKMHDMKAKGGECKMHEMMAGKEGEEKGCKMMQKKQERLQMKKQTGAEHKHGNEEATK